jgi:hypothetical protein
MLPSEMETTHIINSIALVWRITAMESRDLVPNRNREPRAKRAIQELLKELKRRDEAGEYGL